MPAFNMEHLGQIIAAIGALGTTSFALVDATKIGRNGGISNSGFIYIETAIKKLFPKAGRRLSAADAHSEKEMLDILHGNWIHGTALVDQKAIAKSLIKLRLNESTAKSFALATGVDPEVLTLAAKNMGTGDPIEPAQTNVFGRFDFVLTAILDEGYNRADQKYRNNARVLASIVAMVLAVLGGWSVVGDSFFKSSDLAIAILCGLLATPLAPITKDLTSALSSAVKLAQTVKK